MAQEGTIDQILNDGFWAWKGDEWGDKGKEKITREEKREENPYVKSGIRDKLSTFQYIYRERA
jgi:hypothetical protein